MNKKIAEAANILKKANKITVLTGAGISAESGVPTFRGKDGLWKKYKEEDLATVGAFERDPRLTWEWYGYRQKQMKNCEPNPGHFTLAKMEEHFPDFTLITQNIDNLHRRAGSKNILEIHGNLFLARCVSEGEPFEFELEDEELPRCKNCGELIRPHVVWFGENLDPDLLEAAFTKSITCDAFMVIGTSALVHPAASLPVYAQNSGAAVIEINLEKTPLSSYVDVSIEGKSGEILPKILDEIKGK